MAAQSRSTSFRRHPSERVLRVNNPAAKVTDHLSSVTGQFDLLTRSSDSAQVSANDLVAVSMIGPAIPATAAAWILSDEGQWLSAEILASIPVDAALQDCDPQSILRVADLFHLVRRPTSQMPERSRASALGQATATRLLAAKRPGLVPIDDRYTRKVLGYSKDESWWLRWKNILDHETSDMIDDIRSEAGLTNPDAMGLSDLRIFDVLLRA